MQWVQEDPSQSNVDNLNNVRRKASRYFRNKKKEYLKANIEELQTYSIGVSMTLRRVTSLELI